MDDAIEVVTNTVLDTLVVTQEQMMGEQQLKARLKQLKENRNYFKELREEVDGEMTKRKEQQHEN